MGDRNKLDVEGPEINTSARWHHRDWNLRRIAFGGAFGLEQRGAELGRVDRAFQLRPKVNDGTEMVLMGVGEDEPDQILALLFEKADVGHDEIDTRQMFLVAKGYAEIDRKPGALVAIAKPVDRQVHADLTDAPERRKGQFIRSRHQAAPADAAVPK